MLYIIYIFLPFKMILQILTKSAECSKDAPALRYPSKRLKAQDKSWGTIKGNLENKLRLQKVSDRKGQCQFTKDQEGSGEEFDSQSD